MSSCVAASEYDLVFVNKLHAFRLRTSKHSIPSTHQIQFLNYSITAFHQPTSRFTD